MAQSTIIKLQGNKRAHLTYCNTLNVVVGLNTIVTLETLVEVRRLNRKRVSLRFTNLMLEIMNIICLCSKELLFEAVVTCLWGVYVGTSEASFIPVAGRNE